MVNTALFTGLAGLRSHQTHIDVIGANLANVSTPGYRGSRMTFTDLLSFTQSPGSGPNGNFGGTNPRQIGLGSAVGSIDLNTNQGTFQDTGRPLDVAIQGRGFFTLTDGNQNFYTRVGTFGVDANRLLVDSRTGYRVIASNGSNITVPDNDTLPAQPTSNVTFSGALPATVSGPLEEVVESESPLLEGTSAQKTSTAGPFNLTAFDGKSVLVSVDGQAQQRVTFSASQFGNIAAATAAEVVAVINGGTTGVTGTALGTGATQFDTITLGESATLKFDDAVDSTGLVAALGLDTTLVSGTESTASGTTDLANLTTRVAPYASGDTIAVTGTNPNGTPFSATFVYGTNGTTINDFLAFTNALIATDTGSPPQTATASLTAQGVLELRARDKGEATLSLSIGDTTATTRNAWTSFRVTQDGTGPDTATAAIDVIDSLGRSHPVTFQFTRSAADSSVWDMQASMDASEGTITSSTVSQIRFNSDGSFNVIGAGTNALTFAFTGIAGAQQVNVNLGNTGQFDGVSMLGSATTVAATDQDGFGPGVLLNVGIDAAGNLEGFYTNGQSQTLSTLRLSVFANEAGLLRTGDTMFSQSPNSDDAIQTTAGSAGAGAIRSGSLENSNVDIAAEFVNLIEAQRGFQANSRIITTADEILAELVNIVR